MFVRRSLARLCLVPCIAAALTAQTPKANGAAIDRWLESQVAEGFRGQVLLERDGEVVLDRAYGPADEAKAVAATTSTLYYIGSLAKMFTAAVVLQLETEGKLGLGDSIAVHLDGVPDDKKGIGRFPDEHAVIVVLSNRDEVAGKAGRRIAQDLFRQ